MQHIQDNTEQNTDTSTENNAQDNAQPQHRTPAHNYRTYSFDLYHEYIAIKNSNTIKLYTILKILYKKLLYHDIDKPYILLFRLNKIDTLTKTYT